MAFAVASDHAGYTTDASTYSGPVPTIAENDLVVAQLVANTSAADTITPPSGWTVLWDDGSSGFVVSGSCGIFVAWHLVTAAEEASPPASWDFGLSTARPGNIIITHVTGHDPSDVLDTAISTDVGSFSDTAPLTCAALTSTVDQAMVIGGCVVQSASTRTITEPSGWTQDDTTCTLNYGRGADIAHLVLGAAGSTGDIDWLQSGASLSGAAWMVVITPVTEHLATGALAVTATLTGGVIAEHAVTGQLALTAGLSGGVFIDHAPTGGALAAVCALAGGAIVEHPATGALGVAVALAGGVVADHVVPGALSLTATLAGSVTAQHVTGGSLAVTAALAGGAIVEHPATGALALTCTLSGVGALTHLFTGSGGAIAGGQSGIVKSRSRTAYQPGQRRWSFRYELLDQDNQWIADLASVESCTVSMDWLADIKRKMRLSLSEDAQPIDWMSDRIQPWVRLHLPPYGDDDYVEWPQGVFLLSSPARSTDETSLVKRVIEGYDLLQVLIDDKVSVRYCVTAGTAYTTAVVTLLAGISSVVAASTSTLPVDREWPPGTTKLRIINDLLGAINYQSLSFDEYGRAVVQPYVIPSIRTEEYVYADDDSSLIIPRVDQELDLFGIPNSWTLVVSNADQAAISATYTNQDPASPTSTVRRGRTIVDFRAEQDAADQTALDAKVERLAHEASQVYEHLSFATGLNPLHSGNDVYRITYRPLGINSPFTETSWSMTLQVGAPMTHKARRVVSVTGGSSS